MSDTEHSRVSLRPPSPKQTAQRVRSSPPEERKSTEADPSERVPTPPPGTVPTGREEDEETEHREVQDQQQSDAAAGGQRQEADAAAQRGGAAGAAAGQRQQHGGGDDASEDASRRRHIPIPYWMPDIPDWSTLGMLRFTILLYTTYTLWVCPYLQCPTYVKIITTVLTLWCAYEGGMWNSLSPRVLFMIVVAAFLVRCVPSENIRTRTAEFNKIKDALKTAGVDVKIVEAKIKTLLNDHLNRMSGECFNHKIMVDNVMGALDGSFSYVVGSEK